MAAMDSLPHVRGIPPEIWAGVRQQIVGKRTLTNLTRTCRAFRDIFMPFLYSHQVIALHEYSTENPKEEHLSFGFRYTQHIEFELHEFAGIEHEDEYQDKEDSYNDVYAKQIIDLLNAMPQLKSFCFRDDSVAYTNGPALVLREPTLLNKLKTHKTLRNLVITFRGHSLEEDEQKFNSFISVKGFERLTSLELFNFHVFEHKEQQFIRDLAKVLLVSPGLKNLGLGRDLGHLQDEFPPTPFIVFPNKTILSDSQFTRFQFFKNLCHEYSSTSGACPLSLTTLRLGSGMFLLSSDSSGAKSYLPKLFKLDCLRTLHIYNYNLNRFGTDPVIHNGVTILNDWNLLKDCTSLRHVEIKELDGMACQWLNEDCPWVEELIIRGYCWFRYPDPDNTLNLNKLRLPKLAMLVTDEGSCGAGYESSQRKPSILDRLHDHGHPLKRLAVELDFRIQWEGFSDHLKRMPNLTQLHIQRRIAGSAQCFGYLKKKDVAKACARLAKWKCPSLQMICIGVYAWHLTAKPGVELLLENEIGDDKVIQLRPLETDEMLSFDMFTYKDLFSARQCGLSDRPSVNEITDLSSHCL